MGPIGPREELRAIVAGTGCRVREDSATGGLMVDCPSYAARARMLDARAWADALYDPAVRMLALAITRDLPELDAESIARTVHAAVRDRVRYVGEAGELIQDPIVTWEMAAGDCDCQTRLVLGLLRSLGVGAALVGFEVDGTGLGGVEVRHACPTWERGPGDLVWMETTLPARFGEHPLDAAERLGAQRTDLR